MSSTGELMERREANTPINLTKLHTLLMFNESSNYICTPYVNFMTVIKPLINITHRAIETLFLVASYFIMFPGAVSYFHPDT